MFQDPATKFQDPAIEFQDPASKFQDPATKVQDPATQEWVLNGEKIWSSNAKYYQFAY